MCNCGQVLVLCSNDSKNKWHWHQSEKYIITSTDIIDFYWSSFNENESKLHGGTMTYLRLNQGGGAI